MKCKIKIKLVTKECYRVFVVMQMVCAIIFVASLFPNKKKRRKRKNKRFLLPLFLSFLHHASLFRIGFIVCENVKRGIVSDGSWETLVLFLYFVFLGQITVTDARQ